MNPADSLVPSVLEMRWDRIGLGVRCAYNPQGLGALHLYIQFGRRLSRQQPHNEDGIQRRTLAVLLQTAADEALPWPWRAACLEQTAWPLARLTSLWKGTPRHNAQTPAQLQARVQCVGEQLGLPSKVS
ncbi:MAG: hypothetical protein LW768_06595 [Rubrivivax sp.]|jgi:hypothetical protein|nr:hypothetical protein [Rubrivivax sp.]